MRIYEVIETGVSISRSLSTSFAAICTGFSTGDLYAISAEITVLNNFNRPYYDYSYKIFKEYKK